jgi:hypothetical protein
MKAMATRSGMRSGARFWLDTRFLIGILLVVGSVAGVYTVVSAADSSVQVYAARDSLTQGDVITSDEVLSSSVRVDGASTLYLLEGDIPADGLVVTKPVAAGELIPASAVGSAAGLRFGAVVVSVTGQLPASVGPGSLVDLWASRLDEESNFGPPSVLVSSATVVRIVEEEGFVVGDSGTTVELLVPRTKIARLLEAIAVGDALSLVPVSLPAKG